MLSVPFDLTFLFSILHLLIGIGIGIYACRINTPPTTTTPPPTSNPNRPLSGDPE